MKTFFFSTWAGNMCCILVSGLFEAYDSGQRVDLSFCMQAQS
jgi:hypothetical protein